MRIPRPYGHPWRPRCAEQASRQGSQEADLLRDKSGLWPDSVRVLASLHSGAGPTDRGKLGNPALKLTLGSCDKLNLKSDFAHVRDTGRKFTSQLMVAILAEAPDSNLRGGVVCGRKFSLKAVERNRARRLLWESFRLLKPGILPCHMILIPRRKILERKTQDALGQLKRLLKDAGMLSREGTGGE